VDFRKRRLRGAFRLEASEEGIAFDFTTSLLMGAHREDITLFIAGDRLGILDRERGSYWEGAEARRILADSLGITIDLATFLRLALGMPPPCRSLGQVRMGEEDGGVAFAGRCAEGPFLVSLSGPGGKLREIRWPFEEAGGREGRAVVRYHWRGQPRQLDEMVLELEPLGWRVKLVAEGS